MEITLEHTLDSFAESDWNRLAEKSPTNTIFQTYQWHRAWVETIGRSGKLFIVKVVDGELIGVAPLFIETKKSLKILKFIGSGHADYCDFLYPSGRIDVLDQILTSIHKHRDWWDAMALDYIPQASSTPQKLSFFCKDHRLFLNLYARHVCSYIHIDEDKSNLHSLMQKKNLQRDYKRLMKQGVYEVQQLTQLHSIAAVIDVFFDQHIRRRNKFSSKSLFLNDENKKLYRAMLEYLAPSGWLLMTVIYLNKQSIAFHWGWIYNGTLIYYKPSYDPDWAKFSPGDALLMESFQLAIDQNLCEFDFSCGDESYKLRYANQRREIVSFKIFKSRGLLNVSCIVDFIKRLVKR